MSNPWYVTRCVQVCVTQTFRFIQNMYALIWWFLFYFVTGCIHITAMNIYVFLWCISFWLIIIHSVLSSSLFDIISRKFTFKVYFDNLNNIISVVSWNLCFWMTFLILVTAKHAVSLVMSSLCLLIRAKAT